MGLQAGYPYSEIRRRYLQKRSIRACKARVETLEKNGMLANFFPIASQSSLPARSRAGQSGNKELPARRRSNPARRSRFPGVHADQSLASADEATDASYMSPDFSDGEDSDDSYVDPSPDIDVPDASPPDTHNPMDVAVISTMMAPTDEDIDQVQPQDNISVEQTAPGMPQSQEATSTEVEARRIHNSVRDIWNQISQFYIKYPAPDVNVHQIDEWDKDYQDIQGLLWLWPRELPPQYAVVNEEIPMDAPTNLILAHLEYRVAQIKWYGPMRNCDPLRRPNGIFRSPERTCVNAAREIVSILEQHLRRTPLDMIGPHLKALATATLAAFNALKDRAFGRDRDILMIQRITQMLASLLNVLVSDVSGNLATSNELLPPESTPCVPVNAPSTLSRGPEEVPDASNQHNSSEFVPSPSTRTEYGPLNGENASGDFRSIQTDADSAQSPSEHEAGVNAHPSTAEPSNFTDGLSDQRQQRQAATSPMTYAAPSEISQNTFNELLFGDDPMFNNFQS
ncbi:hypothetical protein Z517_06512 [Fonsecaea pedrosoi CBS 271.37]|uniref:Unplaced genomic scaffold supercont1.4, whole genome shotgun sequence n=1 Tax=Fonsecaea pedrosoi CBS 271.37 TaxID=1442368 RepID=A0A0D2EZY5_9EURO|nr:uncharacterized protein Z517_06512 [Fonsecaea pedrosoi CBS 271.37]KIW79897.1 hypothetical protein Z517_06512 [Fonsecaea pedrosoi CBS 271.37]